MSEQLSYLPCDDIEPALWKQQIERSEPSVVSVEDPQLLLTHQVPNNEPRFRAPILANNRVCVRALDALEKREEFAVSLRQTKRDALIRKKRANFVGALERQSKVKQNLMQVKTGSLNFKLSLLTKIQLQEPEIIPLTMPPMEKLAVSQRNKETLQPLDHAIWEVLDSISQISEEEFQSSIFTDLSNSEKSGLRVILAAQSHLLSNPGFFNDSATLKLLYRTTNVFIRISLLAPSAVQVIETELNLLDALQASLTQLLSFCRITSSKEGHDQGSIPQIRQMKELVNRLVACFSNISECLHSSNPQRLFEVLSQPREEEGSSTLLDELAFELSLLNIANIDLVLGALGHSISSIKNSFKCIPSIMSSADKIEAIVLGNQLLDAVIVHLLGYVQRISHSASGEPQPIINQEEEANLIKSFEILADILKISTPSAFIKDLPRSLPWEVFTRTNSCESLESSILQFLKLPLASDFTLQSQAAAKLCFALYQTKYECSKADLSRDDLSAGSMDELIFDVLKQRLCECNQILDKNEAALSFISYREVAEVQDKILMSIMKLAQLASSAASQDLKMRGPLVVDGSLISALVSSIDSTQSEQMRFQITPQMRMRHLYFILKIAEALVIVPGANVEELQDLVLKGITTLHSHLQENIADPTEVAMLTNLLKVFLMELKNGDIEVYEQFFNKMEEIQFFEVIALVQDFLVEKNKDEILSDFEDFLSEYYNMEDEPGDFIIESQTKGIEVEGRNETVHQQQQFII